MPQVNFITSTTPFETLLESWETNVQDFLTFIIRCCGVEQKSETFAILNNNIKDVSDIEKFVEHFDGSLDNIEECTTLYQKSLVH
ncbi:hypothetical protein M6D81_11985 [Paenibacillus sp. J5C_2022]|uniref:hypothetical protein n=1 Tax=Paenibacillus sp. J5C2022 TaxID=2977129 RepID=UPI0021D3334D|nr:hypothetical protein [Paenibacillus sp. J5C2022]MCU6709425.1 hypothetical protein [Paenibacillus sp. J5C2022]